MVGKMIFFFLQGYPQTVSLGKFPQTSSLGKGVGQFIHSRVSPKHLCCGGSTWCRWGKQLATNGGAVYISSCQHTGIYTHLAHSYASIPVEEKGKSPR